MSWVLLHTTAHALHLTHRLAGVDDTGEVDHQLRSRDDALDALDWCKHEVEELMRLV